MNNVIMVPRMTYAIELQHNKFYVGITYNVNQRIAEHMQGHGARWTRLHKPTGTILSVQVGDEERATTLKLMREKGWQNVRGSVWTKIDMSYPPHELIIQKESAKNDKEEEVGVATAKRPRTRSTT